LNYAQIFAAHPQACCEGGARGLSASVAVAQLEGALAATNLELDATTETASFNHWQLPQRTLAPEGRPQVSTLRLGRKQTVVDGRTGSMCPSLVQQCIRPYSFQPLP
jgi:hypothetical protein